MLLSILYSGLFLFTGFSLSDRILHPRRLCVRLWLGGCAGLLLLLWLPALWSFWLGFTWTVQLLAGGTALLLLAAVRFFPAAKPAMREPFSLSRLRPLWGVLPLWLFSLYLLYTHTLRPEDGALHCGQSTFGDMPLHLGLITSIAEQEIFPPEYSIMPGTPVGYPFLCDSVSSTFLKLGAPLTFAYILPMAIALLLFFLGLYLLYREFLRPFATARAAVVAFLLFTIGGGFGFAYFFDNAGQNQYFSQLLTGFYITPTNLLEQNVRWVNILCDMLIPQRATLFGWSLLLPCLFLLLRLYRSREFHWQKSVWLGVSASGLVLVQTHAFLALGIFTLGMIPFAVCRHGVKKAFFRFLPYGAAVLVLALPQLVLFTFRQSGGDGFLRFGWNWGNQWDSFLWFYLKNLGLPFVLLLPAVLSAPREMRRPAFGALLLWGLCEIVIFQPNPYDNNKLLYISWLAACAFIARYLLLLWQRLRGLPGRTFLAGAAAVCIFTSGVMTMAREAVSDYELFSADQVEAAQWISENTAADSVFLTSNNHNNAVSSLTGRNIVLGTDSYLYYHGLDTSQRYEDVQAMFTQSGALESLSARYDIDYVYIGSFERGIEGFNESLFESLSVVFQNEEVTIYQLP